MSRFDRRLKGGGLRPGQSTCNIRNSSNTKVMSSGFSNRGRMGGSNYATAYNPVIPQMSQQTMPQVTQQTQQTQQTIQQNDMKGLSQEQLSKKNRQLEQYALTAPSQELRTMTMHEIRLNKLEWINNQAEMMMEETEDEPVQLDVDMKINAKLAQYTLTTLEPKLKVLKANDSGGNNGNAPNDLLVKFKNLNGISMKLQGDMTTLKNDVKLSKATIKTFAGNLQKVHMLQKELTTFKNEMNQLRSSYKKLKQDLERVTKKSRKKQVELTIEDISKEKKGLEESDVKAAVVKAIKEKSEN